MFAGAWEGVRQGDGSQLQCFLCSVNLELKSSNECQHFEHHSKSHRVEHVKMAEGLILGHSNFISTKKKEKAGVWGGLYGGCFVFYSLTQPRLKKPKRLL